MPGSGVPLLWAEQTPAETDIADAAPIRSIVTSLRNGLAVEHNWPNASGANFGYHLLGSARAFYDVESNVSSSGTDGRLLVTSDTSRLFHVGSAGTMLLGGQNVLSMGSSPVGGQRYYWATEVGTAPGGGTITFPNSGFSGLPFVTVSMLTSPLNGVLAPIITQVTSTNFILLVYSAQNQSVPLSASLTSVMWMSVGTRVL